MGVWRDSVRSQYNEETGARTAMQRGTIETIVARTTRDLFAVLTPRRLMGVNPQVPGSSPGRGANIQWSIPDTWVTVYTGDIGNTFAAKGFSALPSRPVSWSKKPKS